LKPELLEKKRISYSQITTFSTCPLQYRFRYIERIPVKPSKFLSFGDSLHKAIEKFQKLIMNKKELPYAKTEEEILLEMLEKNWRKDGYESEAEEQRWKNKAEKALIEYFLPWFKAQLDSDYHMLFVEEWFEIDFDSCVLIGKIDRVDYRLENDRLFYRIIDFKTSERIPRKSLHSEDTQLYIYTFGTEELLTKKTPHLTQSMREIVLEKIMFFYILPNDEIENSIETEHQNLIKNKIYSQIEVLLNALKNDYFPPKTGNHCRWCDYSQQCPAFLGAGEMTVNRIPDQNDEEKLQQLLEEWFKLYAEITSKEKEIAAQLKRMGKKEFSYNGYNFRVAEEKLDF